MQLVRRFDRRFHFLVCVIGIYSKYVWFVPVKDKKDDTITNSFLNGFKWVQLQTKQNMGEYKASEFYNRSMKSWLQDNKIEMHSTHIMILV